ncbi:hypothetical protein ACSBR2_017496 [Camellia fascicularis]
MEDPAAGGWRPVFRRRARRIGSNSNIHTVFVDEIPESMNPKGLYTLFTNFGIVKDAFIPNKKRKVTNSRIGFVRYDCPVAAEMAIQKMNGTWCDDKFLKVKRIDFGKEQNKAKQTIRIQRPYVTMNKVTEELPMQMC